MAVEGLLGLAADCANPLKAAGGAAGEAVDPKAAAEAAPKLMLVAGAGAIGCGAEDKGADMPNEPASIVNNLPSQRKQLPFQGSTKNSFTKGHGMTLVRSSPSESSATKQYFCHIFRGRGLEASPRNGWDAAAGLLAAWKGDEVAAVDGCADWKRNADWPAAEDWAVAASALVDEDMADAKEKAADCCVVKAKGWVADVEAVGEAASPELSLAKLNTGCA